VRATFPLTSQDKLVTDGLDEQLFLQAYKRARAASIASTSVTVSLGSPAEICVAVQVETSGCSVRWSFWKN
jgi:hypothetical protein